MNTSSSSVHDAIAAIRAGEAVIIVDDTDRENEGDIVIAAEHATPAMVNFMASRGRGLICAAVDAEAADRLGLLPMVSRTEDELGTAFTVSVDAAPRFGVTTGISASDRASTIQVLASPDTTADDLRRPGHMFPLVARPGGVLARRGHTEASTDLCVLAGLRPAAVIVEVLRADGEMARRDDLQRFAARHRMPIVSVEDIVQHRLSLPAAAATSTATDLIAASAELVG